VSGLDGCDVAVYIRASLVGLFDVVSFCKFGVILRIVCEGIVWEIGGVYFRPSMACRDLEMAMARFDSCHVVFGDMNARHPRWGSLADPETNFHGTVITRVWSDMDFFVATVPTYKAHTVIDVCAFR